MGNWARGIGLSFHDVSTAGRCEDVPGGTSGDAFREGDAGCDRRQWVRLVPIVRGSPQSRGRVRRCPRHCVLGALRIHPRVVLAPIGRRSCGLEPVPVGTSGSPCRGVGEHGRGFVPHLRVRCTWGELLGQSRAVDAEFISFFSFCLGSRGAVASRSFQGWAARPSWRSCALIYRRRAGGWRGPTGLGVSFRAASVDCIDTHVSGSVS